MPYTRNSIIMGNNLYKGGTPDKYKGKSLAKGNQLYKEALIKRNPLYKETPYMWKLL